MQHGGSLNTIAVAFHVILKGLWFFASLWLTFGGADH
ncbi:unnamed protein product [Tenebrio molitor]|nr:unnamed protein product [Tenebrio molitor]